MTHAGILCLGKTINMKKLTGKKILITGASGFLGSYLAECCGDEGAELFGIDIRKPADESTWVAFSEQGLVSDTSEALLIENNFDIIFHLAGGANVGLSVQDPAVDFNYLFSANPYIYHLDKKILSANTLCFLFKRGGLWQSRFIADKRNCNPTSNISVWHT